MNPWKEERVPKISQGSPCWLHLTLPSWARRGDLSSRSPIAENPYFVLRMHPTASSRTHASLIPRSPGNHNQQIRLMTRDRCLILQAVSANLRGHPYTVIPTQSSLHSHPYAVIPPHRILPHEAYSDTCTYAHLPNMLTTAQKYLL